jgi:hypothetical protein
MQQEPDQERDNYYQQTVGAGEQPTVKSEAMMPPTGFPPNSSAATSDGYLYQQQGLPVSTAASGPYGVPLHHMGSGGMAVMGGPLVSMSNLAAMYQQVQVQLVPVLRNPRQFFLRLRLREKIGVAQAPGYLELSGISYNITGICL